MNRQDGPPTPADLKRVRARDPEALNAFFDLYFNRAYGYVCRMVRDPDEAEDITQVAFMKIHRAVHTLDVNRDPTSWVFAVVSNAVRDYWRSRRYKQNRLNRPMESAGAAGERTTEKNLEARDTARALDEAVVALTETLRSVVLLRDYEGLSYAETAEVLGIRETAARKRHSRALAELRSALARRRASPDEDMSE